MHTIFLFTVAAALVLSLQANAFPWRIDTHRAASCAKYDNSDSQLLLSAGSPRDCRLSLGKPSGAAPYNPRFPYTGAQNGNPGHGRGLVKVPADDDEDHHFKTPGPNDQRGPCPGLNTAANHGFISRNGITTFTELTTGLQNLYNVGYDFAAFAAVLGISQVGNITTETISIGDCGLSTHGAIEGDASLTRTDFGLSPIHDSHSFNGTLFTHMADVCDDLFDQTALARYRSMRYDESRQTNPTFFFGPKALLLYGASSFVSQLMPSWAGCAAARGVPRLDVVSSFFGAKRTTKGPGTEYGHVPERIPPEWVNRPTPYTLRDFAARALHTYLAYPKEMGENMGAVGQWRQVDDFGVVEDGFIPEGTTDGEAFCHLWDVVVDGAPGPGGQKVEFSKSVKKWIRTKMEPVFKGAGCW